MTKIIVFCAWISINSFIGANGYPVGQAYEVPKEHHHGHHHRDHSDKITNEADQRKLKALDEDDAAASKYTNLLRGGLLLGGSLIIAGRLTKNDNVQLTGKTAFGVSVVGVYLANRAGQIRAQEIKEILERQAKNNHPH